MNREDVRHQLWHPRKETKGRTRWWWYGCAVEKEEIIRELDMMQEAEIGGVELQILYPLQADEKEKNLQNHEYLSPGYFELIRFAADEAAARGMQFDLTLGSSWPFGGPFMPEELCGQNVLPFSIDVEGPCTFYKDLTTVIYGKVVGAVLGKMEGAQMMPETIVDITDHVVDKYLFNWPWGTEIEEIDIPAGLHKIVLFVSSDKKQRVLKPLRGGDGLIIDHNRKDSLRKFLEYGGDPIVEAVGQGKIQNFFCDSIEVFGHNWTDILYDEFRKRRGYELRPYIYALWGEIKGMTDQVRYDYQKTMAELTVENFFQELTAWCHEKGAVSRIQAHGTWGDILQAYGAADIPEGETFSAFDRYEVNTVHRKLAVSAGHVYHKPIISNESFTWLRFPRFVVSLENIKAAADSIFLDGINQIVNHGYSYSKDDDEKMLAFYASTNINHTNTWWKYYKKLSVYINRVCDFMQRGEPVVTTAVYLPQHDIWAETPIADTHMCMKLDERLQVACIDGIHKAGYWFDYVNDDVLKNWKDYGYDTLLLIECDRIPLETMEKIREFAENGGRVIAAERVPSKSCGRMHYEERTAEICRIGSEMKEQGKLTVTSDKFESLIQELRRVKKPDVQIYHHPDTVGYVHRRTDTEEIYFISNVSINDIKETIKFTKNKKGFCVFDPMDGKEKEIHQLNIAEDGIEVSVDLDAYQSLLFVFGQDIAFPSVEREKETKEKCLELSNGWTLEIPQKAFRKEYDILEGWEREPELKYYSGSGSYSKTFQISESAWQQLQDADTVLLELEHIGKTAEIYVNGTFVDTIIKHPYRVDITGLLKQGENRIEITAVNLLINRMIDPEYPERLEETILPQWPYASGGLNECRKERLFNWREREMVKEPYPSGIWGKVEITVQK
ncbi:MAG: hypothetical protein MSA90_05625 [Faecalicatena sp.]|uniref:glycosyl hydrolase n=1 Tax=Faecalicatena sp. TaxID=2005360 RepID=UPI0025892EFA|nr:glycosyl hydrolase [Faecalicatena sp.]MCI6464929.1 hypothetical protein [Faecalicatena sp.]MDY5619870.1 glycosyl hydrolase [Lachnospiraceae bacterium]